MTKTIRYLLLMLIAILVGTYFYITCCSECGVTVEQEPPKEVIAPEATSYPFKLSDGEYSYSNNDNYNFHSSSATILNPFSTNMEEGVASIKTFLDDHIGKVINVTGYYKSDETNNTAYPNLGLARANAVKNHFVSKGISSARINTMGSLMENMVAKEEVYLGPLAYGISGESDNTATEMKALFDKINDNPLVLYFNTAETSIGLNEEQRQKVADISRYLDKVDGANVSVVGHTDNTGVNDKNIEIGLERANFAKAYLMRNSISENKINTSSKGQTDPVESNTTEEGRSKNRRTVVTLNN